MMYLFMFQDVQVQNIYHGIAKQIMLKILMMNCNCQAKVQRTEADSIIERTTTPQETFKYQNREIEIDRDR